MILEFDINVQIDSCNRCITKLFLIQIMTVALILLFFHVISAIYLLYIPRHTIFNISEFNFDM